MATELEDSLARLCDRQRLKIEELLAVLKDAAEVIGKHNHEPEYEADFLDLAKRLRAGGEI